MFDSVLIANRGEIACRIMRTARRMGLRTVAVYSEADAGALHVAMADEAHLLGPPPAAESYLDIDAVLAAAAKSGAAAIHPGYGFLAENAGFAEACVPAGLVFVGPPAEAIRAMGSKSAAKEIMAKAGVKLIPGYHGAGQGAAALEKQAGKIGYPVMLKASAGGGGKGMRVVADAAGFQDALKSARREAKSGFGDDRMLIEKCLVRPRHIEVQIFADSHGNAVHVFERDCSVQRRHQKVIEEAPAPGITEARRRAMGEAAVAAARAIGYVGAGTVEFLADGDEFYFMEMNTRLQVEHAVTEMIAGCDLVEWQFRVAAGEALPVDQDALAIDGHAIEVRLYAEDPANGFLPATGVLSHLRLPDEDSHVRVDSGVREGDAVSIHYDPMIAKLIVWDRDRPAALRRLRRALEGCQIAGVATNAEFLLAVASHKAFASGGVDTGFIDRHAAELIAEPGPAPDEVLALAALAELLREAQAAEEAARASADPYSPWHRRDGWRLNDDAHHVLRFDDGGEEIAVTAHYRAGAYLLDLPGGTVEASGALEPGGVLLADIAGVRVRAAVAHRDGELTVFAPGRVHRLGVIDRLAAAAAHESGGGGRLTAPMPGKIIEVHVADGDTVTAGTPLLGLEAMKMEHTLAAPADGIVREVRFAVGDQVEEGAELVAFEEEEG